MKTIKSTLSFAVMTPNGFIQKTFLEQVPTVSDGKVLNEPPVEDGVLWLVNGIVFANSSREDFIMFDSAKTLRDDEGKASGQGGYITKDGESFDF